MTSTGASTGVAAPACLYIVDAAQRVNYYFVDMVSGRLLDDDEILALFSPPLSSRVRRNGGPS
jgi:hypothetical protein